MARPFIKHLGGKAEHPVLRLLTSLASEARTFIEPMLGGGAAYFALEEQGIFRGKQAILGDADADLISLYEDVVRNPHSVAKKARSIADEVGASRSRKVQVSRYNDQRLFFNSKVDRSPGLQLFLRHAVFNAVFRRNAAGEMNAPPRDRLDDLHLPSTGELADAAHALENAVLLDWSYERYETDPDFFIGPGDLVYLDPPYDGGYDLYIAPRFTQEDQLELLTLAATWSRRGATVVYSNSNTKFIRDSLKNIWPEAKVESITAKRRVSSDGDRTPAPEVIAYVQ
jgi:DNA adenine methylase